MQILCWFTEDIHFDICTQSKPRILSTTKDIICNECEITKLKISGEASSFLSKIMLDHVQSNNRTKSSP